MIVTSVTVPREAEHFPYKVWQISKYAEHNKT